MIRSDYRGGCYAQHHPTLAEAMDQTVKNATDNVVWWATEGGLSFQQAAQRVFDDSCLGPATWASAVRAARARVNCMGEYHPTQLDSGVVYWTKD